MCLQPSGQGGVVVIRDAGIPTSAVCWEWSEGALKGWLLPGVLRCRKHDGVLSLHMPSESLSAPIQ